MLLGDFWVARHETIGFCIGFSPSHLRIVLSPQSLVHFLASLKKCFFPCIAWKKIGKRKAEVAAGAGALWGSGDAQASTAGPRAVFRFSGSHGLLWRRGRPGVNRRLLLREPWAAEPNKVRMSRAIGALPRERRR